MKLSLLKTKLRAIKQLEARINPDRGWVACNREKMLNQIGHTANNAHPEVVTNREHVWQVWSHTFLPHGFAHSFKPVMAVMVGLIITTSGWMVTAYAEPGDVLWNAKHAINSVVETGRLAIASEDERVSLRLSYATKQAEVLRQVVESEAVSSEKKAQMVERSVENLQKKLNSAEESIKSLSPDRAVELVREVSKSTMQISQTLRESAERVGAQDGELLQKLEKKASETTKQSLSMMGVVVQRRSDANIKITEEEEKIVREHIERVVESIVREIRRMETALAEEKSRAVAMADTAEKKSTSDEDNAIIATTSSVATSTDTTTTESLATTSSSATAEQQDDKEIDTRTLTLTLEQALAAVHTLDEQKAIVDLLKQSDVLEALQGAKNLTEQVNAVIESVRIRDTQLRLPTSTDAVTTTETQSTSTLPTNTTTTDTSSTPAG